MKINKNILVDYVRKVSANGSILTINLDFSDVGVKTAVTEASTVMMTHGLLKREAFTDYEEIGEIFIKNSKFFMDLVKTFDDVITIKKVDDYSIKLSSNKREITVLLADESICTNMMKKIPTIKTILSTKLFKSDMLPIVNDMKLLKINAVKIVTDGKKLSFQVGKENEYDYTKNFIELENRKEEDKDVTVSVGAQLINVVDALSGEFYLHLNTNVPIIISETGEHIDFSAIIAPIIENESE